MHAVAIAASRVISGRAAPWTDRSHFAALTVFAPLQLGQRAFHAHAAAHFETGSVHLGMHCLAAQRIQIVVEGLLEVNQATLSWAVGPMLYRRDGQRVLFAHAAGSRRRRNPRPLTTTR